MKYVLLAIMLLWSHNAAAQVQSGQNRYNQQHQNSVQQMQNNPLMQMVRRPLKSSGEQRRALNLLVVQEVATYKLGDETLSKEIDNLEKNQEYYRKLEIIKNKLSNSRLTDSKNKEVMRILNDAGNRIYNLLGN